jgi:hypothetical protein
VKKTFVSDGDAKGYVGVVCSGSKQENNNGEWRRRLRNLNSKFLPHRKCEAGSVLPSKKFLSRNLGPTWFQ